MKRDEGITAKSVYKHLNLWYKVPMRVLFVALILTAVLPAYGSIILFSGEVMAGTPPASLAPGAFTSDTTVWAFTEQQNVLLASSIPVAINTPGTWICCSGLSEGTVAAGTTVDSYLLYASANSTDSTYTKYTGSITFSPGQQVVGIIIGYTNLFNTDSLFGIPGVTYPPSNYPNAGLEHYDTVIVGSNLQSVYVDFHVSPGQIDMIRILTTSVATPEPAAFLLLGSGLIGLALFRRRRSGRGNDRQS